MDPTRKTRKKRDQEEKPTKEQLQEKLKNKLRMKQISRQTRLARDQYAEKLEEKMENAKGKDKTKYRKQLKELEDFEEKEMDNEYMRTLPSYDY